ncbi:hypothetical protein VPH35_066541 [Triticum aestivum]
MADAQPNSGGLAIDPPGKVKKKAAKAPRKPWSECTPEEIARLDAEAAKKGSRRAVVKGNAAAAKFAAERLRSPAVGPTSTDSSVARPAHCQSPTSRTTPMSPGFIPPRHDGHTRLSGSPDVGLFAPSTPRPAAVIDLNVMPGSSSGGRPAVEMQSKQARVPFTGTMPAPRVLFDGMPTATAPVDDPFYNQYMENVIFEAGHRRAYDPEETQSDGDDEEEEGNDVDISGAPLFIDELTQRAEAQKKRKSIRTCSYTQDEDKLICQACMEISQDPRTGQYRELQRERELKTTKFAGGGDGEASKRSRGKTNSKVDDIRDASSMALHDTLHGMMSQKDVRDEKKWQSKDEQMKQYLDLQRKKLEMEEAAKKRKIDMEEVDNVKARQRQLDIEATNAATKAKEVAFAIMSVDLSKMSDKTGAWFEAKQKEMLDAEGLN